MAETKMREPTRAEVREEVSKWLVRARAGAEAQRERLAAAMTPTPMLREDWMRADQTVRVLEDVAKFMDGGG